MENMCLLSEEQYQQCNMSAEGIDELYEALWEACAGPYVDLPRIGEHVYYFPQGHWEQADQETDEVYAQIILHPHERVPEPKSPQLLCDPPKPGFNSFSKVLAASDTNDHCRLYIRKKDAENCLPPLATTEQLPTQELSAEDLYGIEWRFKHVFGGYPPRHSFTTGWSKFVASKRLVQGDSFVFLRGDNGELRVGVRRLIPQSVVVPSPTIPSENIVQVLATVSHAMTTGSLFTVYYRPRKSQFIVGLNRYLQAVKCNFSIGMRFKMQLKGEDSIQRKCIGTIIGIEDISPQWKNSAWRTLKVRWDDSTCSTQPERVSSWEIKPLVAPIPKSLVQIRGKKQHDITFSPVLKRKRKIFEVQEDEHIELGAMIKETTPPPVASLEAVGNRLHDMPFTTSMEEYEILNHEESVQELNNAAAYHDNNPATYGTEQVRSSCGITQSTSVRPSGNRFPIEDVRGREHLQGINITDISHAVLSSSSPDDAWFRSIFRDVPEQVECQREALSPRQQSLVVDPLMLPQGTSSTGLESSPTVMHISSIPNQITFSGPGNGNELVNWEGYCVAQRCIPTLNSILKRHPNTLSSFRLRSQTFQYLFLEVLAELVVKLERLTVGNMDEEQLDDVKCHLSDLKINGIDVHWLERRLEHIVGVAKKNILARRQEELARKVVEARETVRQLEGELSSVDKELEEASSIIGAEPLSADHSVMQGLL
ncbi:hypothetical protein ACH5RR_004346 [Cinchona calisaya]|uniref:Auxin response factor n=1 Tax=Cinchona calisaya TaxID=153742 RepID=A0ABD3AXA1_9GENT